MLRSGSPDLVRQELAAWAAGTEMTRGVARDAALAAVPARKGRRAGAARPAPRDLPRPHPPRDSRRYPRRENRLRGADQGNREVPHHRRPEQAPRPQVEVAQQLRPRQREGHPHPHRPRHHHHGQPASLTSADPDRQSRSGTRRPVEPAVSRHDTPASGMPAPRNYSPLPTPETGTGTQIPKPHGIGRGGGLRLNAMPGLRRLVGASARLVVSSRHCSVAG
jgi:hypothetical protein